MGTMRLPNPFRKPEPPPGPDDALDRWRREAGAFRAELETLKRGIRFSAPDRFWLPYDILSNLDQIDATLTGERRDLARLAGDLPVADIGAADGDLAFYLERQGFRSLHIVDTAATNCNRLEGAARLAAALGSSAQIHDLDLDAGALPPAPAYGLVFFLGTLYHLRHPLLALEGLARKSRYCLLATRIARTLPGGGPDLAGAPMAYLLAPGELNGDITNHWIFTPAGLRRLAEKAGWEVLDWATFADGRGPSEPASMGKTERAFCLLASRPGRHAPG